MAEEKTTEEVMKEMNKKYQSDSVVFGDEIARVEVMDTGCHSLNAIFGPEDKKNEGLPKGIPKGRLIEISGASSVGKTALAYSIVSSVQKQGGKVAWVDAERVFSPDYVEQVGIDLKKLLVATPESGEEALDIIEKLVETGEYALIVLDSVSNLTPQKERDAEKEDVLMALIAKLLTRHLRVVTAPASRTRTTIIYINQLRDNFKTGFGYAKQTITTGGQALKFYSSVRLEIKAIGKIKDKADKVIGNHLTVEGIKNKCGIPFVKKEIDIYFTSGIDVIGDILETAVLKEIITKTGNSYTYLDSKFATSRDAAIKYLEEHPEIVEEIKVKLIK